MVSLPAESGLLGRAIRSWHNVLIMSVPISAIYVGPDFYPASLSTTPQSVRSCLINICWFPLPLREACFVLRGPDVSRRYSHVICLRE